MKTCQEEAGKVLVAKLLYLNMYGMWY